MGCVAQAGGGSMRPADWEYAVWPSWFQAPRVVLLSKRWRRWSEAVEDMRQDGGLYGPGSPWWFWRFERWGPVSSDASATLANVTLDKCLRGAEALDERGDIAEKEPAAEGRSDVP